MAFDAYFLSAVLAEIRAAARDARVEKIHQPSRDTLVLLLRCGGGRQKLLIAAAPAAPRLHLTQETPENPAQPPMFCMLLRKHLLGARLVEVTQPPMERAARFTFACTDELGQPTRRHLVAELMGRTCNIYLLDDDARIIDCLRRVAPDESERRPALPGLRYRASAPIEKRDARTLDADGFEALLREAGADELAVRLMDCLGGLSPLVCRETALYAAGDISARLAGTDVRAVSERLAAFFGTHLADPAPYYCEDEAGAVRQFAFCPIMEYGACARAESFGALLDRCYALRDRRDAIRQKSQAVRKAVGNHCRRLERKMQAQGTELAATRNRERLRQFGDIVTANLHRMEKGQTALLAEDLYDEEMKTVSIPLSPLLTPQQNAAKYYKDYARMKTAERELTHQMALGREELAYLQSVLEELDRAETEQELDEIRAELCAGGYLRAQSGKKQPRQAPLPPLRYESAEGYPILVGRNNRQNDALTLHTARKDDLWLHTQKAPGSHVIIACAGAQVSDGTVTRAAELAAYHSHARQGSRVAVDVARVKYVKKPAGAKPGMVVYTNYRTVFVDPKP